MWFGIISLFPEMFSALNVGITGRALKEKLIQLQLWNPRDYATDKHQSVDDRPYGGGPGMVMMAEPLKAAITAAKQVAPKETSVVYLSPQGTHFNQAAAVDLASRKSLILLAGRYEGIDERTIEQEVDEEWSVGDYILTGGELGAMIMIDVITRLMPGAVGDGDSVTQDSLTSGLLKYPQYTRPEHFGGLAVPDVLLSGHHQQIERWRLKASLGKTWLRRPDLLAKMTLSEEEQELLAEFIEELPKSV
jgi:tRNA (guanine37-N1)-methyltransferase